MPSKKRTKKSEEESASKKSKVEKEEPAQETTEKKKAGKKAKGKETTDSGGGATWKIDNTTDFSKTDFSSTAQTKDGRPWNLKIASWNVNGIRAWLKTGAFEYISKEDPDIFCLQETKCAEDDLPNGELQMEGYHIYWYSAQQKGYSGTGLYSKQKPLNVTYGLGIEKHDTEGRVITAEYDKFYLVTSYVPNAGQGLKRLDYRVKEWDVDFRAYLKDLDSKKPVVLCGDLNVAHNEIDLANPKGNRKTAGFTVQERESFGTLLAENGFKDSFRSLYPETKEAYSYWSYRTNARVNNKGWRLDYFVVSERVMENVCDHLLRSQVYGSDHCPIVLLMAM